MQGEAHHHHDIDAAANAVKRSPRGMVSVSREAAD